MLRTLIIVVALTQIYSSQSFASGMQKPAPISSRLASLLGKARVELGRRYEHSEGVARDFARARKLYCEAARSDVADAYFALGWMYVNGRGVTRDDSIAVFWIRKAVELGVPQAANILRLLPSTAGDPKSSCVQVPVIEARASKEIERLVATQARAAGLDPKLVMAVISAESGFDPNAVSRKNARGLMQLSSETATRFKVQNPFSIGDKGRLFLSS